MNLVSVSVCVVVYNQKQFIRETLNSVLDQNYTNIEIVVADDGSTDGTAEVVLEYAQTNPGKIVALVGGNNLGITGNSNRGLNACTGKYIAFLGGDDLMLPGKLKAQVEYMESNPACSICYHNLDVFDNNSGKTLYLFNNLYAPYSGGVSGIIKHGTVNGASSTMVRRSSMPLHGFDEKLPVASDWCFWIETLLNDGGNIFYIDEVLGRYRRHDRNVTKLGPPTMTPALRDNFDTCAKVLSCHPQYSKFALYRLGSILRGLRWSGHYSDFLFASLRCSVQLKTLAAIFIYYLTLRRIKI
jgi:glycosyltransferase involved in cell wall biosynthesis